MEPRFLDYFSQICLSDLHKSKISMIIDWYESVCNVTIVDLFVSEVVTPDESIVYESLFLVSDDDLFEAKKFLSQEDYDSVRYKENVKYWNITSKDYSEMDCTNRSKLKLYLIFDSETSARMAATGINCSYLMEFAKQYFIPNMSK